MLYYIEIHFEDHSMHSKQFRWWYALIIFLLANLFSAIPAGYNGDKAFYNNFQQPVVAPPDWLFAPMWLFLNITSLVAMYRVANLPASAARSRFLISEAIGWVLFSAFTTLYFLMKSPVLGAVDTVLGLLIAMYSMTQAKQLDQKTTLYVGLRFVWLCLASYVSVWVALHNADELLATRAIFMP
jgi:translocator protein